MSKILSVVTPFYNESEGIDTYFEHLFPVLEALDYDYEIVCIDDGSRDSTYAQLEAWGKKNDRLKLVRLSRNFGKEAALTAGLDYATGDAVIPIDADLQDDPELFPAMLRQWEAGFDVVLMQRKSRNESWAKKLSAHLFYQLISRLSGGSVPENVGDFRLMDRKVVDAIQQLNEKSRFMKGLLSWPGFTTTVISYDRPERAIGNPKQSIGNLFRLAITGIFAFSSFPLRIWTFIGMMVTFMSFIFAGYLVARKIIFDTAPPGYLSLMVVLIFFNGLLMVNQGLMGEYISRIFDEVKARPVYIVHSVKKSRHDQN